MLNKRLQNHKDFTLQKILNANLDIIYNSVERNEKKEKTMINHLETNQHRYREVMTVHLSPFVDLLNEYCTNHQGNTEIHFQLLYVHFLQCN